MDWPALVTAIGVAVAAILSGLAALNSSRARLSAAQAHEIALRQAHETAAISAQVRQVAEATNGMQQALITAALIRGIAKGRAEMLREHPEIKESGE